jgi:predicted anti-sigma-YlaC factor YlaD
MMTCKEIAELLMAYCDGELAKEYADLICHHIRLCGPCKNFLDSYQVTIRLSRQLPMTEIPQHLVEKIKAMMEKERNEK